MQIVSTDKGHQTLFPQKTESRKSFSEKGGVLLIPSKDALFLSFIDAKLSLTEFDSTIQDLKTLSMHYFEDELAKEGQWLNYSPSIVRVDSDMRCACMLIYNSKLVIIPFFSQLDREIITSDTIPSTASIDFSFSDRK